MKKNNIITLKFIKEAFIVGFQAFISGSLATKYISLNDEPYLVRPTLINLNPDELHYYPFMVSMDRCNESCNTRDDALLSFSESWIISYK